MKILLQEGRDEGRREVMVESILGMYAAGISLELIAKSMKMPPAEIEKIIKEQGMKD